MFRSTTILRASCATLIAVACLCGPAASQDTQAEKDFGPSKFSGYYSIYSGALGDEVLQPTKKDAKVRFTITGRAAVRIFDYMGSGAKLKNECADNEVSRSRGDLMCTLDKNTHKTECYFGVDLHSGKTFAGIVC